MIFSLGLGTLFICILSSKKKENDKSNVFFFVATLSWFISGMCFIKLCTIGEVKPIDVYQGKTDLKITYEKIGDKVVAKDSVVVFKK